MTDKQIIIDGEHDMNYCEDNNCKHYGNKEQCEKTHCYYRCYSKLYTAHKAKEQECEKLEKGYIELTDIVSPYIDDFTGYNEELKGFDIVLCVRELMQQLGQLKEEMEKQRALKQTYLACYKTKHRDVKGKLFKYENLKQTLQEIKEIALQILDDDDNHCQFELTKEILNKIEELKIEEC